MVGRVVGISDHLAASIGQSDQVAHRIVAIEYGLAQGVRLRRHPVAGVVAVAGRVPLCVGQRRRVAPAIVGQPELPIQGVGDHHWPVQLVVGDGHTVTIRISHADEIAVPVVGHGDRIPQGIGDHHRLVQRIIAKTGSVIVAVGDGNQVSGRVVGHEDRDAQRVGDRRQRAVSIVAHTGGLRQRITKGDHVAVGAVPVGPLIAQRVDHPAHHTCFIVLKSSGVALGVCHPTQVIQRGVVGVARSVSQCITAGHQVTLLLVKEHDGCVALFVCLAPLVLHIIPVLCSARAVRIGHTLQRAQGAVCIDLLPDAPLRILFPNGDGVVHLIHGKGRGHPSPLDLRYIVTVVGDGRLPALRVGDADQAVFPVVAQHRCLTQRVCHRDQIAGRAVVQLHLPRRRDPLIGYGAQPASGVRKGHLSPLAVGNRHQLALAVVGEGQCLVVGVLPTGHPSVDG